MSDAALHYDLGGVGAIGAAIARAIVPGDVLTLAGGLGAGKTTLARAILHGLGHEGEVPSPTFAIVQPYDDAGMRLPVLHCDLYRIEHADELDELGLEEALGDGALLIEWPERLGGLRWPGQLDLAIAPLADGRRRLTAQLPAAWKPRWPFR